MCIFAVTPLAGVWIEMCSVQTMYIIIAVTPLAGVWIEIDYMSLAVVCGCGHSLGGSVD